MEKILNRSDPEDPRPTPRTPDPEDPRDIGGHPRFRGTREWVAASAPPTDWLQLVNQPQTEAEVAALRCCIDRGRPFGDPNCA